MVGTYPRTKEQTDKELAILRKHQQKRRKSKKEMLAFLVRVGLVDKNGNPTERYRNDCPRF